MNILEKIVKAKKDLLNEAKEKTPIEELIKRPYFQQKTKDFKGAISKPGTRIIAEVKKASPSKGIIVNNFSVKDISRDFDGSDCDAISVLTEEKYFFGSLKDLELVKKTVSKPVLRKDFLFDDYQIYESKAYGADALLLIASLMKSETLIDLVKLAYHLQMDALVEVNDESDLRKALQARAKIIGINNRNLETFKVDIQTSAELSGKIPNGVVKVSESGINSSTDIKHLKSYGINAFLIGESLLTSQYRIKFIEDLKGGFNGN